MTDASFTDYPTRPIGDGNPYRACEGCGRSDPEINGRLEQHLRSCPHRRAEEVRRDALARGEVWAVRHAEWTALVARLAALAAAGRPDVVRASAVAVAAAGFDPADPSVQAALVREGFADLLPATSSPRRQS